MLLRYGCKNEINKYNAYIYLHTTKEEPNRHTSTLVDVDYVIPHQNIFDFPLSKMYVLGLDLRRKVSGVSQD